MWPRRVCDGPGSSSRKEIAENARPSAAFTFIVTSPGITDFKIAMSNTQPNNTTPANTTTAMVAPPQYVRRPRNNGASDSAIATSRRSPSIGIEFSIRREGKMAACAAILKEGSSSLTESAIQASRFKAKVSNRPQSGARASRDVSRKATCFRGVRPQPHRWIQSGTTCPSQIDRASSAQLA
jgi:hypothetical protein